MLKRIHQDEPCINSLQLSEAFQKNSTDTLSIGRDTASNFTLNSSRCPLLISRNHALLKKTSQHLELEDLDSTNGT